MKKKVYFILTSVIQIIVSIAIIATAEKIAQTQLDSFEQIYAGFPADFQERMRNMLENGGRFIVSIPAIITLIMNVLILKEAVKIEASKIILIHNHPTGDPTPSKQDIEFTEKVEQASKLLGIQLLDHIVIGNANYESIFSQREKILRCKGEIK